MAGWSLTAFGTAGCAALAVALATCPSLLGCNTISGADDIGLDPDDEGGPIVPAGQLPQGGAGGTAPVGGGPVGGFGTGGEGAGPVPCEWPPEPYGVAQNQVLAYYKQWQGYRENGTVAESIPVTDYYDCDGSKGINAVLFTTSQWQCGACQEEAAQLEALAQQWAPMGIKVQVNLVAGQSDNPATVQDALMWRDYWGLLSMAVVADPLYTMVPGDSVGTPQMTVVDPRTMRVTYLQEGYSGQYNQLIALAQQNATQ